MTTHYQNNQKTLKVESTSPLHHKATVSDDYGNVLEVVHYTNQKKDQVQRKISEQGLKKSDLFLRRFSSCIFSLLFSKQIFTVV